MKQFSCHKCKKTIMYSDTVNIHDTCDNCKEDLHCCKNCKFYSEHEYNNCNETQAERILDKEKSNFCDFFRPNYLEAASNIKDKSSKENVYKKLDSLFK